MSDFYTGQGTATETPTPIVEEGCAPQELCDGITIMATSGLVYISSGILAYRYPLKGSVREQITIPVDSPSKVFVSGEGTYAWYAV